MTEVSQVFGQNNRKNLLDHLQTKAASHKQAGYLPWETVRGGEMPPMMFQIKYRDGRIACYNFGDIREIHSPDAGTVQLVVHSTQKQIITLEGRHLKDLVNLFCNARIKSIHQSDPRNLNYPVSEPEIEVIRVDPYEEQAVPNLGLGSA